MSTKEPFEHVYEENYDRIYRYVFSILLSRAHAEDVVADTFFSALYAYGDFDPQKSSVTTWLTRIAHNKAINILRSREYSNVQFSEEISEMATDANIEGRAEASAQVLWLYRRLTPEERGFLDLRYGMEFTDKEVAKLYSISDKAVNKRYQRLLKKCRKIMEEMQ